MKNHFSISPGELQHNVRRIEVGDGYLRSFPKSGSNQIEPSFPNFRRAIRTFQVYLFSNLRILYYSQQVMFTSSRIVNFAFDYPEKYRVVQDYREARRFRVGRSFLSTRITQVPDPKPEKFLALPGPYFCWCPYITECFHISITWVCNEIPRIVDK